MKRILLITILSLVGTVCSYSQVITGKQAHALLDGIVMGGNKTLDKAQLQIIDQQSTGTGSIKVIELASSNAPKETYVASYDATSKLIDGMFVAVNGDVKYLKSETNNEYVWFVPQGEARVTLKGDSVLVTRCYNIEMKPLGDDYMRHCVTSTSRYALRGNGTFEQLATEKVIRQVEGKLVDGADGTKQEMPPSKTKVVKSSKTFLAPDIMDLLHAPHSAFGQAMSRWLELEQFFAGRETMTGIDDAELWSRNFLHAHAASMLSQGDGEKMTWLYEHQYDEGALEMVAKMYEYISILKLEDARKHLEEVGKKLKDKNARKWWKF